MERFCLDCNEPLKGRTDKKFCDDSCRTNYHNHLKSEDNPIIKRVNGILKKNRAILSGFTPNGKSKVNLKKLQDAGFNFSYLTHIYRTQNGNTYHFCYEYGLMRITDQEFVLVKREEK